MQMSVYLLRYACLLFSGTDLAGVQSCPDPAPHLNPHLNNWC